MKSKIALGLLALVLLAPLAEATNFTENFETYRTIGQVPDPIGQNWYKYSDASDIGNVTTVAPILQGAQSLRLISNSTITANNFVTMDVITPNQLTNVSFIIQGATLANTTLGSKQVVQLASSFPVRDIVQFYIFCRNDDGNSSHNDGCEFRVRWQEVDASGQVLIPYNATTNRFNVNVVMDWKALKFNLTVNNVNDGTFPFYQLPADFDEIKIFQYQPDIPLNATFDLWTITGALNVTTGVVDGDIALGIQDFASNMHFTSGTSLFVFGIILFIMLNTALLVAMFSHGKNNTIAPAAAFFTVIVTFWLIQMKFWPDWINVVFIIYVSSMVGLILRRVMLGIRNTGTSGPSMVIGALGYFVICGVFLAMAGYNTATVTIPSAANTQAGAANQSFGEATIECIVTLFGDCSQHTVSKLWATITDIFGWILASVEYLFQLMTFQLPIPVVLNMVIVIPPAAALGAYAIQLIRG